MADAIEETDVAVVGAGGGGAVLALALAKQGVSTVSGSVDHGGVADEPPFNLIDRVIAAGLLPDLRANEKSPHPMSS